MNRKQRRADKTKHPNPVSEASPALQALCDEGLRHYLAGRLAEAETSYRQVLAVAPNHADALHLLGVLAGDTGHAEVAAALIGQAIAQRDNVPVFHNSLGNVKRLQAQPAQAIMSYERALTLQPDYAEAHNNLGLALTELGRLDAAEEHYRRALALSPDIAEIHNNLGLTLKDQGRLDEALASYNRAIALKPDYAAAHWNRAFIKLLTGDFAAGWAESVWRWRLPDAKAHGLTAPLWDGGDISGKTILLHGEQGLGDTIQFIRYAALVKARRGRVLLACPPALARLLQSAAGIDEIFSDGHSVPAHDCQAPLLDLPGIFHTDAATIPAQTPYLSAPAERVAAWREKLAACPGLRVGIVWRGSATHKNDRNRSMTAAQIATCINVPDASIISLQKDATPDEIAILAARDSFYDAGAHLGDFADTAALMANLDLVLSVDTSVCHLAGALARPVWTLLPFGPDWRWQLERNDSPWYPTMRLFRQPAPGDWQNTLQTVRKALRNWKSKNLSY